MNELQIFESEQFGQVRTITEDGTGEPKIYYCAEWDMRESDGVDLPREGETPWQGYVYVLEVGGRVKIGSTRNLAKRIKQLRSVFINYHNTTPGLVFYSLPHTNYLENEKLLHEHYKNNRFENSEMFHITFDDVLCNFPHVELEDDIPSKKNSSGSGMDAFLDALFKGVF